MSFKEEIEDNIEQKLHEYDKGENKLSQAKTMQDIFVSQENETKPGKPLFLDMEEFTRLDILQEINL